MKMKRTSKLPAQLVCTRVRLLFPFPLSLHSALLSHCVHQTQLISAVADRFYWQLLFIETKLCHNNTTRMESIFIQNVCVNLSASFVFMSAPILFDSSWDDCVRVKKYYDWLQKCQWMPIQNVCMEKSDLWM